METAPKLHFLERQDGMLSEKNKFHLNSWMNLRFASPKWNICSLRQISSSFCFDLHQSGATTRKASERLTLADRAGKLPEISLILNFLRENRRTWCDWLRDKNYFQPASAVKKFLRNSRLVTVELAKFFKDFFFYTRKVPLELEESQDVAKLFHVRFRTFFNEIVKHQKVEREVF